MSKHFIAAALLLLSGCSETPTSQSTGGEAVGQPEEKPIAVGVTGKSKGVDITMNSVKVSSLVGPAGVGIKAEAGETYVVANYTIKNTATDELDFLERPAVTLIDGSGKSYTADEMAGALGSVMASDSSAVSLNLNPGTSTKAATGWKISKQGFDASQWRIVVESEPTLTFALK